MTVQVVAFLCVVSFAFNEAFDALFIILLALFHDLTIVTIAYDHQLPSPHPEQPTVMMLIVVAYSMGAVLSTSSVLLYVMGEKFLSEKFSNPSTFRYKETCMFLQLSNSSAILIFNARTTGFSFLSVPAIQLFMSAVVSQCIVNTFIKFSGGFIVEQLESADMLKIWAYDLSWLIIIDLVKMGIIRIQDGPMTSVAEQKSRTTFMSKSGARMSKGLSKDLRVSISGQPKPY